MPDDEGAALLAAAAAGRAGVRRARARAHLRRDRRLVRQVDAVPGGGGRGHGGACCSASTTTTARRRTRPAGTTTTPSSSTRPTAGSTPCPIWRRAVADAGLEHVVVGVVGDSPTVAARWRDAAGLLLHRRRARRASRRGPTSGDGRRYVARGGGWPSTTCSPTRPTAVAPLRAVVRRRGVGAVGRRRRVREPAGAPADCPGAD